MSSTSVAVFGYGILGKHIVSALVEQDAKVLLLSRDASKLKDVPAVVKTASVDYTNETQVAEVLKEHAVDAVVISLGLGGTGHDTETVISVVQVAIARASKAAGVKLFVPNEFGANTEGYPPGSLLGAKNAALAKIQEIGIPTVRVVTGLFTEFIPWATSSATKPGEFVIAGKGDKKVSFTALSDIGGYVAHILTSIPLPELYNKSLLIEGHAATFQEVAQVLGKKITYVSPEEIDQPIVRELHRLAEEGNSRTGYILTDAASKEVVDKRSSSGNALWKGHQWKEVKDVYAA